MLVRIAESFIINILIILIGWYLCKKNVQINIIQLDAIIFEYLNFRSYFELITQPATFIK